jgi:hypothetical protein
MNMGLQPQYANKYQDRSLDAAAMMHIKQYHLGTRGPYLRCYRAIPIFNRAGALFEEWPSAPLTELGERIVCHRGPKDC